MKTELETSGVVPYIVFYPGIMNVNEPSFDLRTGSATVESRTRVHRGDPVGRVGYCQQSEFKSKSTR